MPYYSYPGQTFDNKMTALKGWLDDRALDLHGTISSDVDIGGTGEPVMAGMVVHVSDVSANTGAYSTAVAFGPNKCVFEMGAAIKKMPIFVLSSSYEPDVSNPGVPAGINAGGDSTHIPAHIPILPAGVIYGLVAKGPFELELDTYDPDQTYAPNDFLRAVTHNTDDDAGRLTNQVNNGAGAPGFNSNGDLVFGTDTVVARVSRGEYTTPNRKTMMAVWPENFPGTR